MIRLLIILIAALLLGTCGDDDESSADLDGGADGDTDADADTDSDADSDSDTETDAGVDAGSDDELLVVEVITAGSVEDDEIRGLVVDSDDNKIIAGMFSGTIDFGGHTETSAGGTDGFVAKFDYQGKHLCSASNGTDDLEEFQRIEIDAQDEFVVTGLKRLSGKQGFLVKYDATCGQEWSFIYGDDTSEAKIRIDSKNQIYAALSAAGPVSIGGEEVASALGSGLVFLKMDGEGSALWAKDLRQEDFDGSVGAFDVVVGAKDKPILVGLYSGEVEIEGTTYISELVSAPFLGTYDADGQLIDLQEIENAADPDDAQVILNSADADSKGDIVLAGDFYGAARWGDKKTISRGLPAKTYLEKYNSDAQLQWLSIVDEATIEEQNAGNHQDVGTIRDVSIVVDKEGDVIAAGKFDQGTFVDETPHQSAGENDIIIMKYSKDGEYLWSYTLGGKGEDAATAVAVDSQNRPVIAGYFSKKVDFGGTKYTSNGGKDIFVMTIDN